MKTVFLARSGSGYNLKAKQNALPFRTIWMLLEEQKGMSMAVKGEASLTVALAGSSELNYDGWRELSGGGRSGASLRIVT